MEKGMLIFWIVALVSLVVVESLTVQLVTIWFALGSLGALIANLASASIWLQWTIFAALSLVSLLITRPLVRKIVKKSIQPTNADRCIGAQAIVTEKIDNMLGQGMVKVKGATWTARSKNGIPIDVGSSVTVDEIEGVKVLVSAKDSSENL